MMPSLLGQSSTPGRTSRERTACRKAVLFCQSCGHESPIDGDWRIARVDRRTRSEKAIYTCPECARTVTVRPDGGRGRSQNRTRDRPRTRTLLAKAP